MGADIVAPTPDETGLIGQIGFGQPSQSKVTEIEIS